MPTLKSIGCLSGFLAILVDGISPAHALVVFSSAPPDCYAVPYLSNTGATIFPKLPTTDIERRIARSTVIDGQAYCRQKSSTDGNADQIIFAPGKIVENADPDSFIQLRGELAKDKNHVYWDGAPVLDANPTTAKQVGNLFWKDDKRVFYKNTVLVGADPVSFTTVSEDEPNISLDGFLRMGPRMSWSFSKDATHVYWENKQLPDADPKSFQARNFHFAKDKAHAFFHDQGAPLSTYKTLGIVTIVGNTVYWNGFPVKDADAESWEQLPFGYARDKNAIYHDMNKLNNIDPASFQVINKCFVQDDSGYFRSMDRNQQQPIPLGGLKDRKVRTLNRTNEPNLFMVCTQSSYDKYGGPVTNGKGLPGNDGEYPGTCCMRDEANLYLFTNDPPEAQIPVIGTLKVLPIKDIQCVDSGSQPWQRQIKFNDTVYLNVGGVFESAQSIIAQNHGTNPGVESATAWGKTCTNVTP